MFAALRPLALAVALTTLSACNMDGNQGPSLDLTRSANSVYANESVTLFANTRNMMGRDPEIRWSTNLGRIEPDQGGRIARFSSSQPGTATITIEVITEAGQVLRDKEQVTVKGLR
jgi:hypothetical protein